MSPPPALFAVLSSAVLYALAFPPARARMLAWVALVPLLVAVRRAAPRAAWGLGAVFAIAGTGATVSWLPAGVSTYYAQPWSVGLAMLVGVALLTVVPWVTGFVVWYRALPGQAATPLLAAAGWVAAELARASLLGGNPWVLFGYSQVGADTVVQIADLAGVYGISFVLVAVNATLAELWLLARDRRLTPRAAATTVAAPLLVLALVLGYGRARLVAPPSTAAPTEVAVVQGNVDLGTQWSSDQYGAALEVYLRLTLDALRAQPARLVVWPESAMTFFVDREPAYRASIASVLEPFSAELVAGGVHLVERGDDERFYNAAYAIAPDGAVIGRYDKHRLLPFAEYFPFPQLDLLRRNFGRVRQFTPGDALALVPTPLGPAGVLICNEALFAADARQRARAGATVLLNLSNDSWMGDRQFSEIAFDMTTLRAVEQRRYLVRASTSGPSAIVDPLGRVTARSALRARDVIAGQVAASSALTPYARVGDLFAGACAALAVALLAWRGRAAFRLTRRRSAAAPPGAGSPTAGRDR